MRKGYELIGLRVIGVQDVSDLGKSLDLIFDQAGNQCLGLVMSEGGLLHEAQVIPWDEIRTVGQDAIMVNASTSKVGVSSVPELQAALQADNAVSGERVMTTTGNAVGTLGDVYLDETTGRVQGYEVSGGVVSDAMSGKNFLPVDAIPAVGNNTVLVAPEVESLIQGQNENPDSGLKSVAQSAGDKLSVAGDKLTSAYETVKDKATETYANIASASVEKQKEFVVGKVAGQDVYLPAKASSSSATASSGTTPDFVASSPGSALPVGGTTPNNTILNEADLIDRDLDVETTSLPREGTQYENTSYTSGSYPTGTHAPDVAPSFTPGESTPHFDPRAVSAPGLNFNEVEPATILDPIGEKAGGEAVGGSSRSSAPHFDPSAVSAPGLNFNEREPATVLDPLGERAGQDITGQSTALATTSATTTSVDTTPEHGELLVAKGQTITQQQADTAESAGILHQLLLAVGSGAVAGASETAQDKASDVASSGEVKNGLNNASVQASQLLSSAKDKGSQLVSAAQERKAEYDDANTRKRINHALGRPVTRVILAKDDTVILNVGDLITNRAVRMAHENGALETLLSSVYDEEPQITPAMARTTEPGTATIPSEAPLLPPPATAIAPPEQNDSSQQPQGAQPQPGQPQGS